MRRGAVTGVDWNALLRQSQALDPYLIWADATGFAASGGTAALGPDPTLPFLIEAATGALTAQGLPAPLKQIEVPLLYRQKAAEPTNATQGSFFTARVRVDDVPALVADASIQRFQLCIARAGDQRAAGRSSRPVVLRAPPLATGSAPEGPDYTGAQTVVGIIDDGCPFAHDNLADGQGRSRVRYLWDQAATLTVTPWAPATGLIGGAELCGHLLDRWSGAFPGGRVYPALGVDRISGRPRTHGSAICHLAAGRRVPVDLNGRRRPCDAASELPIVFVQLPLKTVADTTGGSIGLHVLDALHYIQNRAEALVGGNRGVTAPRVIVNLSYGSLAGPHDGSSLVECALTDFLVRHDKVSLVVAAGNSNREPLHASFTLAHRSSQALDWMVGPDHPLESYLEIWWPEGVDLSGVTVELWAPGDSKARAVAGVGAAGFEEEPNRSCGVVFCQRVAQGMHGAMTLVALRATRGSNAARPGRWRIVIANAAKVAIKDVHVWVERNDLVLGRRRRQQARLLTVPAEPPKRGNMVLASMSNIDPLATFGESYTNRYLVLGASRLFDGRKADYSSTGPSRGTKRMGPDGLAPADLGPAQPGLLVDGPVDGQWTRASGSSVAAAVTTRQLAALFEHQARDEAAATPQPPRKPFSPPRPKSSSLQPPPSSAPVSLTDAIAIVRRDEPTDDGWFQVEVRNMA